MVTAAPRPISDWKGRRTPRLKTHTRESSSTCQRLQNSSPRETQKTNQDARTARHLTAVSRPRDAAGSAAAKSELTKTRRNRNGNNDFFWFLLFGDERVFCERQKDNRSTG